MCSGRMCTGERGDKRCQPGRASSELLMAALFRSSFAYHNYRQFKKYLFNLHLLNLLHPQIVGVAREDEGRYDAFADNGLGVRPKYQSTSSDQADEKIQHGRFIVQAPVTQYVVLSVDAPRDLPARIVDTDADVTMSLGK